MGKIIGILLAAGASSRMGENKLSLPIGETFIGNMSLKAALFSKLDHVLIITSQEKKAEWLNALDLDIKKSTFPCSWEEIISHESNQGQSASLKTGIEHAQKMRAEAVVILLGDQPFMTADKINQVIDIYSASVESDPVPFFSAHRNFGTIMPPILFPESFFFDLLSLSGDTGARILLKEIKFQHGMFIDSEDLITFTDIDTPEDYIRALKVFNLLAGQ